MRKNKEGFVLDYSCSHKDLYNICVMVDVLDRRFNPLILTHEFAKFVGGEKYLQTNLMQNIPNDTTESYVERFEYFVRGCGVDAFIKKMDQTTKEKIKECSEEENFVGALDILSSVYLLDNQIEDEIVKEILEISFIPVSELQRRISQGNYYSVENQIRNLFNKEGMIQTIKFFRQQTGYGLRDAKNVVELLLGVHNSKVEERQQITEEEMIVELERQGYSITKPKLLPVGTKVKVVSLTNEKKVYDGMVVYINCLTYVINIDEDSHNCGFSFHNEGLEISEATVSNFNKIIESKIHCKIKD